MLMLMYVLSPVFALAISWLPIPICTPHPPMEIKADVVVVVGLHTYASLYYTTLHYTTLHYTTLHYTTLHYTTLHYTTLHYTTLHYTTLHYTTLHYTTLHYTTLHYTTLHYTHYRAAVNSEFIRLGPKKILSKCINCL